MKSFMNPWWSSGLATVVVGLFSACSGGGQDSAPASANVEPAQDLGNFSRAASKSALAAACPDGTSLVPFDAAASAPAFGTKAQDFTFATVDGRIFKLSDEWTGCESFVILTLDSKFGTLIQRDAKAIAQWLSEAPESAKFIFVGVGTNAASQVQQMQASLTSGLAMLPAAASESWARRIFIAQTPGEQVDGWFGQFIAYWVPHWVYQASGDGSRPESPWPFLFAIDRQQVLRDGGSFVDLAVQSPLVAPIRFLNNLAKSYDFELARQTTLDAQEALTVTPIDHVPTQDPDYLMSSVNVKVRFPEAAVLQQYNALDIDLSITCDAPEALNCAEWDSNVDLFLCDGLEPLPDSKEDAKSCNTLLARWITPYARASRWVVDASHALAMLPAGREVRLRLYSQVKTVDTVTLRLHHTDEGLPFAYEKLWINGNSDGAYDGILSNEYNANHPPLTIHPPADATSAELRMVVSGHGASQVTGVQGCAEFCNHGHRFTFSDAFRVAKQHPMASTAYGCMDTLDTGTIPNQFGTWIYGRGGWCPGNTVIPWIQDVTEHVTMGGETQIVYEAMVNGNTTIKVPRFVASSSDPNKNANESSINMWSYVVYRK
jgi:Peptide-N-glycosidase F, C terminal